MCEKYSQRIKLIRKKLQLSQLKFATSLGLTQGGYSDIERGRNNLSGDIKLKLSNLYRVNISFLEDGKGEMFNHETTNAIEKNSLKEDLKTQTIELLNAEISRLNSERELYIKLLDSKDKIIAGLEYQIKNKA